MLAPTLPDLSKLDREALQALLLSEHQERIATQEKLQRRETEIEHLKLLLSQLRRMQFGPKSEKLERQIEQLELRLEDLQQAQAAEQTTQSVARLANQPSQPTTQAKPGRRPLPEHLPRQTQTHMPKQSVCPDCGGELRKLSEDVSEMLEYVRACFQVIRHVRPKLSCQQCERIVQARRRAGRLRADWRDQVCWRMSWFRSMPIIFPFTGNARSMSGTASNWRDQHWRTG
jgi:DNA repair exonuclease SbcCD ATPase subunit